MEDASVNPKVAYESLTLSFHSTFTFECIPRGLTRARNTPLMVDQSCFKVAQCHVNPPQPALAGENSDGKSEVKNLALTLQNTALSIPTVWLGQLFRRQQSDSKPEILGHRAGMATQGPIVTSCSRARIRYLLLSLLYQSRDWLSLVER